VKAPAKQTSQFGQDPLRGPATGEVTLASKHPIASVADGNPRTSRGPPELEPLVVPPKVAKRLLNCGNETLWRLLHEGELESYLDGASRKIVLASIHAYVDRKRAAATQIDADKTRRAVEKSVLTRRAKRGAVTGNAA
jgi:excisionase family DNA binding protein